ncbi:MAG: cbb3-type cytochrome c oxidase subunit I, partial [Rhodocyclaceae bacterium]|nr:cbb3-type cytochrome c oxidase subunit I [Rhodocyclaceae bacterium]
MAGAASPPPLFRPGGPGAPERARAWLLLATVAIGAAAFFAILIVLARIPAVGALFPGPRFYKVALTLHVNLAQLVWFMSFAGLLWSLASRDAGRHLERAAFWCCAAGASAMAASPALGAQTPVTSNYLPVLDHPAFLAGATLFAGGMALQAWRGAGLWAKGRPREGEALPAGLAIAAATTLLTLALLVAGALELRPMAPGPAYFEALFWGPGHAWQFTLVVLMMVAWLGLAGDRGHWFADPARARGLLLVAALPLLAAPALQALHPVLSGAYRSGFTDLMRYGSWPAPALLALALLVATGGAGGKGWRRDALRLSALLFAAGLLLGAAIDGQTTVVTAHYHGTIGAVTLAFMGLTHALLPLLGGGQGAPRLIRRQLALYGNGILLMMAGLAGAGFHGAPRKVPGNVAFEIGPEFMYRLVMGLGGSLATAGILMFIFLVVRESR